MWKEFELDDKSYINSYLNLPNGMLIRNARFMSNDQNTNFIPDINYVDDKFIMIKQKEEHPMTGVL